MTHCHRSHLGGLALLKEQSGAPVYAHQWEADLIAGERKQQPVSWRPYAPVQVWPLQIALNLGVAKHPPATVDHFVHEGDQIGPLRVVACPGHSPGHLSFWWEARRLLIAGDAICTWPSLMLGWRGFTLNPTQHRASVRRAGRVRQPDPVRRPRRTAAIRRGPGDPGRPADARPLKGRNHPMAQTKEYWLQLENLPWDVCPWGVDRATGLALPGRARRRAPAYGAGGAGHPALHAQLGPAGRRGHQPLGLERAWPGAAVRQHPRRRAGGQSGRRDHRPLPQPGPAQRRPRRRTPAQPARPRCAAAADSTTAHSRCRRPIPARTAGAAIGLRRARASPTAGPARSGAAAGAWLIHDGGAGRREEHGPGRFGRRHHPRAGRAAARPACQRRAPARRHATRFAAVPAPPKRGEYVLLFHELPGVGLCLNGRQALGNTPTLVAGMGTRLAIHCLNACRQSGHRAYPRPSLAARRPLGGRRAAAGRRRRDAVHALWQRRERRRPGRVAPHRIGWRGPSRRLAAGDRRWSRDVGLGAVPEMSFLRKK